MKVNVPKYLVTERLDFQLLLSRGGYFQVKSTLLS